MGKKIAVTIVSFTDELAQLLNGASKSAYLTLILFLIPVGSANSIPDALTLSAFQVELSNNTICYLSMCIFDTTGNWKLAKYPIYLLL